MGFETNHKDSFKYISKLFNLYGDTTRVSYTDVIEMMAEMASAPASMQASAGSVICVILGVIFGMTEIGRAHV